MFSAKVTTYTNTVCNQSFANFGNKSYDNSITLYVVTKTTYLLLGQMHLVKAINLRHYLILFLCRLHFQLLRKTLSL